MSTLIPEYQLSEFQQLTDSQIRELKSCELYSNGDYLCTVIIPRTPYIRTQSEYMGLKSNSVGGKELAQVLTETVEQPEPCPVPEKLKRGRPSKK